MLTQDHVEHLREMDSVEFDGSTSPSFELYYHNNLLEERRKKRINPRTDAEVWADTAKGIGWETVLSRAIDDFHSSAPVVENPREEIPFKQLMTDFHYGDQIVQAKCITKLLGCWAYITEAMKRSIEHSYKLNDYFIFGFADRHGSRQQGCSIFTYRPAFTIDSKLLNRCLCDHNGSHYIDLNDKTISRPEYFQALCPELLERAYG